jgi:aryl-alcohol dehydrogenase-like predicted oxidoreductase
MRYKLLGASGLRVSELCLGTMTLMDGLRWGTSKNQSRQIVQAFFEAGGNFLDTSNTYGTSEEYLGEFLGADRGRAVVGTKYTGSAPGNDPNCSGNHRKSLVGSVEGSLKRLGTDYLDLLWVGAWDFMTPPEEIMRALDDLVRTGKLLYAGISNSPAWFVARANTLAELRGWTPFVGLQVLYNLLERDAERELLPLAAAMDLGVTAWSPLASGFLTGKYAEERGRPAGPRRLDDPTAAAFVRRSERNRSIAQEVANVAAAVGATPAQVALNWLRHRGVIPIFGARTPEQVKENVACLGLALPDEHLLRLEDVSQVALGYPHDFMVARPVRHHLHGGMFDAIDNHRRWAPRLPKGGS